MKKFLSIGVLFFLLIAAKAQTLIPSVKEQLEGLNSFWKDKKYDDAILKTHALLDSDVPLIKMHLSLVEQKLRQETSATLSRMQKEKRNRCLDSLHAYWQKGQFPKNTHHTTRTPYFIDDFGTPCAVGYLIIATGYSSLSKKISSENNYEYLASLKEKYSAIKEWAVKYGFTTDELAWIQPTYGPPPPCNNPCAPGTQKDVTCYGGNDGCYMPDLSAYTGPFDYYTYKWDNTYSVWSALDPFGGVGTLRCPYNLGAGDYKLDVSLGTGVYINGVFYPNHQYFYFTINEPPPDYNLSYSITNVLCHGDSTGSIKLSITGANGKPLFFKWNTPLGIDSTATGVKKGYYYVDITTLAGCKKTFGFTVSEPPAITITDNTIQPTCWQKNGCIKIVAQNGIGTYNYLWQTGETTDSLSNLSSGNYAVTVSDSKGCFATRGITITEPLQLNANINTIKYVSCNGMSDGILQAQTSGGVQPYNYLWSNSETTTNISGITAGTYTLTVTDANTCNVTTAVIITEPQALKLNSTVITNATCYGGNDGSAIAVVSGGTQPYTYLWSNNCTTSANSNLVASSYTVTVTDNHGCTATATSNIIQPPPISSPVTKTPATAGFCDGTATVSASGGNGGFTYLWNNGQTTPTITGLCGGAICNVTVSDITGCGGNVTVTIDSVLVFLATITTSPTHCGDSDGLAIAHVKYGQSPYNYLWSNGSTISSVTGLAGGNFSITITDNMGATATATASVAASSKPISGLSYQHVSCAGGNDGFINSQVVFGVAPYIYLWSNNATTVSISGLTSGNYTVTITDSKSCTNTNGVMINAPSSLEISVSTIPSTGNDGFVSVYILGGTQPYSCLWSNGSTDVNLTGLAPGTYYVTITDSKGCEIKDTAVVSSTIGIAQLSDGRVQQVLVPNPFNDDATFTYMLPKSIKTGFLRVYDIKGVLIRSYLLNSQESSLNISASDFENGVYLYGIEADGFVTPKKKMVVVKN